MATKLAPRDIRAALRRFHYDMAGAPVPELLGALLQIADPGKLHYGSDWPFTPAAECRKRQAAVSRLIFLFRQALRFGTRSERGGGQDRILSL